MYDETIKEIVGKTVESIAVGMFMDKYNDERNSAGFKFTDGTALNLWLDADCCSSSYWEHKEEFDALVGAKILDVEERENPRTDPKNPDAEDFTDDHTCWHFLVFTTDKGHVTIEWRNDSNGYYDGTVNADWVK